MNEELLKLQEKIENSLTVIRLETLILEGASKKIQQILEKNNEGFTIAKKELLQPFDLKEIIN